MCAAGEGKQAFHVVAPSIPGFAFSSAPTQPGFGLKQIAKTFNQLMLELGYSKYVAQGQHSTAYMIWSMTQQCMPAGVKFLEPA